MTLTKKQKRELREEFEKHASDDWRETIAYLEVHGKRGSVWSAMRTFVYVRDFYAYRADRGLMLA